MALQPKDLKPLDLSSIAIGDPLLWISYGGKFREVEFAGVATNGRILCKYGADEIRAKPQYLFMRPKSHKVWRVLRCGNDGIQQSHDFATIAEAMEFFSGRNDAAAPFETRVPV